MYDFCRMIPAKMWELNITKQNTSPSILPSNGYNNEDREFKTRCQQTKKDIIKYHEFLKQPFVFVVIVAQCVGCLNTNHKIESSIPGADKDNERITRK